MSNQADAENVLHGLSAVLGDHVRLAAPEVLERHVLDTLSRLSDSEAESFSDALGDVGQFFKSGGVRDVAGKALPILGMAIGTAYGGPAGAAVGGSLGSAAGQAIAGKRPSSAPPQAAAPARQDAPAPAPGSQEPVPGTAGEQPAAAATPVGSTAAAQLLSVIQNPALLASLLALVMGPNGKASVPVGSTEVPVGALMNLVGVLANRAAEDAEDILAARQDATPAYLLDESGCLACDPAIPSQRADALLRLLSSERRAVESSPAEYAEVWEDPDWW